MALLTAMRPQEWIKNVLVFAGVLFSGRVDKSGAVGDALLTFVAFCAISSAGYLSTTSATSSRTGCIRTSATERSPAAR